MQAPAPARVLATFGFAATLVACGARREAHTPTTHAAAPSSARELPPAEPYAEPEHDAPSVAAPPVPAGQAEAIFAGGCFWCMESPFEHEPGVVSVTSGYTGGERPSPSYNQVSRGGTGHFEAVRVLYDPARVGYARLLEVFFHNIDPTQATGQFCDEGSQYRSAVFTSDAAEKRLVEQAIERAGTRLNAPITTQLLDASTFWVAEAFHQDFYRNHEIHYASYRMSCGRDARLRELWGESASH